jgi:hypothetical protein
MKTHTCLALALALLAVATGGQASAAPAGQSALAHPVGAVERSSSATIMRGSAVIEVERALGTPTRKLGDDVWIYRGYSAGAAQPRHDDCDTLVVTFVHGTVSDLQLVNAPAVALLERKADAKNGARVLAIAAK